MLLMVTKHPPWTTGYLVCTNTQNTQNSYRIRPTTNGRVYRVREICLTMCKLTLVIKHVLNWKYTDCVNTSAASYLFSITFVLFGLPENSELIPLTVRQSSRLYLWSYASCIVWLMAWLWVSSLTIAISTLLTTKEEEECVQDRACLWVCVACAWKNATHSIDKRK